MWFPIYIFALLCACLACGREKPRAVGPAKSVARANIIKAFFNSPLKNKGRADGIWSVDAKEFTDFIQKSRKDSSVSSLPVSSETTRYFLRIEGLFCDELFFVDGGDFTMSAGGLKKLEVTKDRTIYSVVFNREIPGGIRLSQGAILTVLHAEKRLELAFPDHKLTFFSAAETPSMLADRYGVAQ